MTSDNRALRLVEDSESESVDELAERYRSHLERSPISDHTRRAYDHSVKRFLGWLDEREDRDEALADAHARDFAVRDFRLSLKSQGLKLAPATVNAALAAIDNFYRWLGLGAPQVKRDTLPAQAPRSLSDDELRKLLRAVESRDKSRDRAIICLMTFAGLRISEVAALDVEDVVITARKGEVTIQRGKGDATRKVPLGSEARDAISALIAELGRHAGPLIMGPGDERLSVRGVSRIVNNLGSAAGLKLSAHDLRHTYVPRLIRNGHDVVLVAELSGHRSLETTRRYALPTAEDKAAAVEDIAPEF